jgi:hypothetical protein
VRSRAEAATTPVIAFNRMIFPLIELLTEKRAAI